VTDTPTIVLAIHGFGGSIRDYRAVKKFLQAQGHTVELHEFTYPKRFGQVPLREIADELGSYVRSELHSKKFYAIGFSQGGLIFRMMIMQFPDIAPQVIKAITVCTPHSGSYLAFFAFGKGIADLRPGSRALTELNQFHDPIHYYALYNPYDLVVIPATNAKLATAIQNEPMPAFTHSLTFRHPATLRFIESALFEK
jgi:pimeloyl-ACP methyl ester carboxylesterase